MHSDTERRAARRFTMSLPLTVRLASPEGSVDEPGETRDISFRGLFFSINKSVETGAAIEFVLTLPQQITNAGDVHIRCYAKVLRIESDNEGSGVAARIERYEFLPPAA
jgi:PilZ domain